MERAGDGGHVHVEGRPLTFEIEALGRPVALVNEEALHVLQVRRVRHGELRLLA